MLQFTDIAADEQGIVHYTVTAFETLTDSDGNEHIVEHTFNASADTAYLKARGNPHPDAKLEDNEQFPASYQQMRALAEVTGLELNDEQIRRQRLDTKTVFLIRGAVDTIAPLIIETVPVLDEQNNPTKQMVARPARLVTGELARDLSPESTHLWDVVIENVQELYPADARRYNRQDVPFSAPPAPHYCKPRLPVFNQGTNRRYFTAAQNGPVTRVPAVDPRDAKIAELTKLVESLLTAKAPNGTTEQVPA
jgi:hypothetical protein